MTNSTPPHEPAPRPPQVSEHANVCGAQQVQDRVGGRYDESLGEQIQRDSGAAALRVIRPGHAYTMDYREERINVHLDDAGIITEIDCG